MKPLRITSSKILRVALIVIPNGSLIPLFWDGLYKVHLYLCVYLRVYSFLDYVPPSIFLNSLWVILISLISTSFSVSLRYLARV